MAPSLCRSLEPSLLLLRLNKPSFTSAPAAPVLSPANEPAGASACSAQGMEMKHWRWQLAPPRGARKMGTSGQMVLLSFQKKKKRKIKTGEKIDRN